MNKQIELLRKNVRNISNFPKEGIEFKDVTTLFKNSETLKILTEVLVERYKNKGITKIVGIESRGFIMGPILALKLNAGFVPIRKVGKLPADVYEATYEKEYGEDIIQIHKDAISEKDVVLIHDDLLATGGTMEASYNLVRKTNQNTIYINTIIELEDLKGKELLENLGNVEVDTIIKFDI